MPTNCCPLWPLADVGGAEATPGTGVVGTSGEWVPCSWPVLWGASGNGEEEEGCTSERLCAMLLRAMLIGLHTSPGVQVCAQGACAKDSPAHTSRSAEDASKSAASINGSCMMDGLVTKRRPGQAP